MSTLTIAPAFRPSAVPSVVPSVVRSTSSTVRLTRRGRLVVFVAALVLAFAVGIIVSAGSVATDEAGTPEPTRVVTVSTGDTLWAIASDLAEDGDVQEMMTDIERLNALDSGMLSAGQRLVVPAG